MRVITWDQYFDFCLCPRRYMWLYHTTNEKTVRNPHKDTQFLTRGNVIQALVGKWAKSGLWKQRALADETVQGFLNENVRSTVQEEWISDEVRGTPAISPWSMIAELEGKMRETLKELTRHLWEDGVRLKPERLTPEYEVEAMWGDEVQLQARLDLCVFKGGMVYVYEGKSTRYVNRVTEDQLRWQLQLLWEKGVKEDLGDVHYYFFYHTNEVKEVLFRGEGEEKDRQRFWLARRDATLKRLVLGQFEATPTSGGCRFCPFRGSCPDCYVSKRRTEPAFDVKAGGSPQIEVL